MFVGRNEEMDSLKKLFGRRTASFVAIRGRRRIGKSRLIKEFSKHFKKAWLFTGIPPRAGVTAQNQRDEFCNQLELQGIPLSGVSDWSKIFWFLGNESKKGKVLIALDEIAWMGSKDPTFLGKLKIAWDQAFSQNPNLVLIVSSSIASWMDENILQDTGFFGRIDLTLTLREIAAKYCSAFWDVKGSTISAHEKLKLLNITGGVPRYLEEIDPKLTTEENIQELCFTEGGLLFKEFDQIFHDLFSKRSTACREIVEALADARSLSQKEICQKIGRANGRKISEYLRDLTESGFISADFLWDLDTAKLSKIRRYRLCDNYLRFYLKYILPNKQQIIKKKFKKASLYSVSNWDTIMGYQFENLVLNNSWDLFEKMYIRPEDYEYDGPYYQSKKKNRKGCQIDYVIKTKNNLYICEVKFSKNPIGTKVIQEVKEKVKALDIPKHLSCRSVLIHVGGVTKDLVYQDYFSKIIDWTEII